MLAGALALGRLTSAASTLPFPNARGPLLLHLEGTLGTERAKVGGFTAVSLGFHGQPADTRRWLGVEEVHPLGDYGVLGKNVLDALAPFEPNLIVVGPPVDATRLLAIPAGTRVTIEGLVDRASRTLFLRRIEEPAAPTP